MSNFSYHQPTHFFRLYIEKIIKQCVHRNVDEQLMKRHVRKRLKIGRKVREEGLYYNNFLI